MEQKTINEYVTQLLSRNGVNMQKVTEDFKKRFAKSKGIIEKYNKITEIQKSIMDDWEKKHKQYEMEKITITIPNATKGTTYSHQLDVSELQSSGAKEIILKGLESTGLSLDKDTWQLSGTPEKDGIVDLKIDYVLDDETFSKSLQFIINPNPRDLWKNLPSNKEDIFWKEDNASLFLDTADKKVVISSKRGRSHQNVGSFRDDDFAFKYFEKTGWNVVVVSDGAGSAKLSRKGSQMACEKVVEFLGEKLPKRQIVEFDEMLNNYAQSKDEEDLKELKSYAIKNILYKSTLYVHSELQSLAKTTKEEQPEIFEGIDKNAIDLFHATLIYALYKKVEGLGYIILTFGVGDCPIGLVNKDKSEAKLLNWLDVGEFGGGTRFITQGEIFHSKDMGTRFNVTIVEDFSFLFLMTDGIYDAKFIVEANLEKTEKWMDFIDDLKGNNEDEIGLDFSADEHIEEKLNEWMDFWSKGNHDDRTLAIVH